MDETGGIVRVLTHSSGLDSSGDRVLSSEPATSSDQVLRYALSLSKAARRLGEDSKVVLVTKDAALRVRASALRLLVEDYKNQLLEVSDFFRGYRTATVASSLVRKCASTTGTVCTLVGGMVLTSDSEGDSEEEEHNETCAPAADSASGSESADSVGALAHRLPTFDHLEPNEFVVLDESTTNKHGW